MLCASWSAGAEQMTLAGNLHSAVRFRPPCTLSLSFYLTCRSKVMRSVAIAITVLCSTMLCAQEHPAINAQQNTVYVGADGKYESAPDTALFQFNIAAQEETSKQAYDR